MRNIPNKIIENKKPVLIAFFILTIFCVLFSFLVETNFDLLKYLPEDSKSTIALKTMDEEFSTPIPNARVLLKNTMIAEAMEIKSQLKNVTGVLSINWLDDVASIYTPVEMLDKSTAEKYFKNGNALFTLTIDDQNEKAAVLKIREILGERGEITGDAVDIVNTRMTISNDALKMMLFVIPIIFLVLLISTSSWFEPVLFFVVIGISVILNAGTNAFLGEISFITKSTAAILQLAISTDYSIFLLHRFKEYRSEGYEVKKAMLMAMRKSFSSIFASGLTTIIGFLALVIMQFKIGADLGIVLAKGIVFSLISIMFLLPVLTIYTYKLIDKTAHRSFLPSFKRFANFAVRISLPMILLVGIIVVPAYLAQYKNNFIYSPAAYGGSGSGRSELTQTEQLFGVENNMVLMVPRKDLFTEKHLSEALKKHDRVSSVISYTEMAGLSVPQEFVPQELFSEMVSKNYSRIILTVKTPLEGDTAFTTLEDIRDMAEQYYGDDYHLAGMVASIYDIKNTIERDNFFITLAAIIGVGLILLLIFRSLSIPFVLLLSIEVSIWLNFAYPYFANDNIPYLGFIIVSSVQLGATIDYAILFASRYIENRKLLLKKQAAIKTISDTAASILSSATILTLAGLVIGYVSSNGIIGQLGFLLARGAVLSSVSVLFLLPALLLVFDKLIQKTTFDCIFLRKEKA